MGDGATMVFDLVAVDLQYSVPATDYLIFDWNEISSSNPSYIPKPTDYFVVDFTPHAGPESIGQVLIYDGSFFDANEHITDLGTVIEYDGTTQVIDLKTTAIAYLQSTFNEGTSLASSLATTVDLTGDADLVLYEGAENDVTFTTHPAIPITTGSFPFYDGATMSAPLGTTFLMQDILYEGSSVVWDLDVCIGCNSSSATFYDGSELIADVAASDTFAGFIYDGSSFSWDLATRPFWAPTFVFYDGAESVSDLATQSVLTGDAPAVAYDGSEFISDITLNPPWQPTFVFYDGAEALSSLATQVVIVDWMWAGDEMVSALADNPQWHPSFVFYDGATAVLPTIAAQQSLPPLIGYEGSTMSLLAVSNLDNWYIYDGSQMLSNLATQVDLTADGPLVNYDGSYQFTFFTSKPSQPLANQWPMYAGESFQSSLVIKPAAKFSVVFWGSAADLQVDFSTSTHHIDLARQCAVNQPDSYFYWKDPTVYWNALTNGGVQAIPGALATGFNTYMQVTLAVHEHLNPLPMYQGDTFGIYDFWPLLSSSGEMGFGMTVLDLKFDLDIPLCYGNFIPDGDAVNAELSTIDDTSCSVDQAYDGSSMSVFLENNIKEKTTWYEGSASFSTLTTEPALFIQFWSSESMFVASNAELKVTFMEGEFLTIAFKADSYTFFDGATMVVPTITTDYTVQFMEVGCLQNEYVPDETVPNPFGPPPTANIELRPYVHQIQAECF